MDAGAALTKELVQPTRARLFAALSERDRPSTTAELAVALGLHANGIRVHLARMERSGLVRRERRNNGRGRPTDTWTVAPEARPAGDPPQAGTDLARWLARSLAGHARLSRDVEQTGMEIGRELGDRQDPRRGAADRLRGVLASLGFQPRTAPSKLDRTLLVLESCPYRSAVAENPQAVCGLHRGIARGVLEVRSPDARLTRFEPADPQQAGCLIEIAEEQGRRPR